MPNEVVFFVQASDKKTLLAVIRDYLQYIKRISSTEVQKKSKEAYNNLICGKDLDGKEYLGDSEYLDELFAELPGGAIEKYHADVAAYEKEERRKAEEKEAERIRHEEEWEKKSPEEKKRVEDLMDLLFGRQR